MQEIYAIIEELSNLNPPKQSFDNQLIEHALKLFELPQNNYKVIHIAGTNGKGSTAAFIEAGLITAGYKVGKFSSPFIHCINECICVNNQMIASNELAQLYLEHKKILELANIYLSSFEMLTLLMFVYCARVGVDYLVLEAGLGGLNDSTNVVDSVYSVITNVSLEHTQFLGNSLDEIAMHKAGIIKNGLTVVGDNHRELLDAVKKQTDNFISVKNDYAISKISLNEVEFTTELKFKEVNQQPHSLKLGLFGYFQAYNFLCAYAVLNDIGLTFEQINIAAKSVLWHGRLQKLSDNPLVIADASHNVDGVRNLSLSLAPWFDFHDSVIICSILTDKNQLEMMKYYRQISANIIFCEIPNQPRASNLDDLLSVAAGKFINIYQVKTPEEAMQKAQELNHGAILVSGSCYLLKYFISS